MRFKRSLLLGAVGALALAMALPGVGALASVRASSAKPTITIGSENFEESTIVANIWSDVLTKAGYSVTVEPSLGARAIVVSAIEKGQINLSRTTRHRCSNISTTGPWSRLRTTSPPPCPPTRRPWHRPG